jgi:hypothetical protein
VSQANEQPTPPNQETDLAPLEADSEMVPPAADAPVANAAPAPVSRQIGYLASLACIGECPEGAYSAIYQHLAQTLTLLEHQAIVVKSGTLDNDLAAMAGPFIARSIIEATCTALIGRFDPFRILMIREKQLLADYDYSERNSIAMNWNSDFHIDAKPSATIAADTRIEAIPRSLFGKYYEKALWIEAVERYADADKTPRSDWMIELNRVVPGQFIPNMRQDVQRLYSRCSKAIHQEFVVKNADYSDQRFIVEQLGLALELMAKLSVVFGCSPHILHPKQQTEIFEDFQALNERWSS